jgi:AcrR family transcriptional regulator
MRRIAIELGVPTMALYRRVRGKNSLLLLMADTILGQVRFPVVTPPRGWRAQLELVARLKCGGYRKHLGANHFDDPSDSAPKWDGAHGVGRVGSGRGGSRSGSEHDAAHGRQSVRLFPW